VGVDRERGKLLDFVVGGRSQETGRRRYEGLRRHKVERFYTDFWQAYQAILAPCSHKALKAETHGMERVHSLMRHYLARVRRRSRCFRRSVEMMVYSLQLLFFSGDRWRLMGIYNRLAVSFALG